MNGYVVLETRHKNMSANLLTVAIRDGHYWRWVLKIQFICDRFGLYFVNCCG